MNIIILENLIFYIKHNDYINLSLLCKEFNNYYKNNYSIYEYFLNNKFSVKFTKKLKLITDHFYISYKNIYLFEKELIKFENKIWSEEQYFTYWKILENIKKNNF